jgi:hypothetical protein
VPVRIAPQVPPSQTATTAPAGPGGGEDEMRTYDPADGITYVHLAPGPAAPPVPPQVHDECRRLPAGYANAALLAGLGEPSAAGGRPALVVLPGGSAATAGPSAPAPALRLAR